MFDTASSRRTWGCSQPRASLLGMTLPASPLAKTATRYLLAVAMLVCLSPAASSQATPSASSEDAAHRLSARLPEPGPLPNLRSHLARRQDRRLRLQRLQRLRTAPDPPRARWIAADRCGGPRPLARHHAATRPMADPESAAPPTPPGRPTARNSPSSRTAPAVRAIGRRPGRTTSSSGPSPPTR